MPQRSSTCTAALLDVVVDIDPDSMQLLKALMKFQVE